MKCGYKTYSGFVIAMSRSFFRKKKAKPIYYEQKNLEMKLLELDELKKERRSANKKKCCWVWCNGGDSDSTRILHSQLTEEQREDHQFLRRLPGYYRSKKRHKEVYNQLKRVYMPHVAKDKLRELLHNMDTQKNESMNTLMSHHNPKNKNYSRGSELPARAALVVGIDSIGRMPFCREVLDSCEIVGEQESTMHHLSVEDESKRRKRERELSIQCKSRRIEKKKLRTKELRKLEIQACERGTTYGDMKRKRKVATKSEDGGSNQTKKDLSQVNNKKKRRTSRENTCLLKSLGCTGKGGHKTGNSKDCLFHDIWMKFQKELPKNTKKSKERLVNLVTNDVQKTRLKGISDSVDEKEKNPLPGICLLADDNEDTVVRHESDDGENVSDLFIVKDITTEQIVENDENEIAEDNEVEYSEDYNIRDRDSYDENYDNRDSENDENQSFRGYDYEIESQKIQDMMYYSRDIS